MQDLEQAIRAVATAFHAEAEACFHAVKRIQWLELETDCITLQTALTIDSYDAAETGALIREIKFLLAINFTHVKAKSSPISCNSVAHRLASMGARIGNGGVSLWPDLPPDNVISLVADDFGLASS